MTVALVAFVARVVTAAILNTGDHWSMAPDAGQYLAVAEAASDGRLGSFWLGYGESLYRSTWTFSVQVKAIFEVFGPFRALGQAISVFYGVATAVLATSISLFFVRRPFAVLAGLIVALTPSQVLWSSVALRESTVWALLVAGGFLLALLARRANRWTMVWVTAGLACSYIALSHLRTQTAFLFLWSAAAAMAFGPGMRKVRFVLSLLLLLVAPLSIGRGVADLDFLSKSLESLGTVRTYMAMNAESAINQPSFIDSSSNGLDGSDISGNKSGVSEIPTTSLLLQPDSETEAKASTGTLVTQEASVGENEGDGPTISVSPNVLDRDVGETDSGRKFIIDQEGYAVAVQNDLSANLETLPRGLVAVTVRPVPWEGGMSTRRALAGVESVLWSVLFAFAAAGAWLRRKEIAVVAYPVILTAAMMLSGAVTQGNLGTAFRHRGQILWALAVLSVAAAQRWVDQTRRAR